MTAYYRLNRKKLRVHTVILLITILIKSIISIKVNIFLDFINHFLKYIPMEYDLSKIKEYQKISFVKLLGIEIVKITNDEAIGKMKVKKNMKNYMSYLHGGVIASFIDTIAFFPGKLLPSGRNITTTSLEVKYIRPVNIGEELIAKAQIIHLGKKIGIIEVSVFNPAQKLVAKGTVSVMNIDE